METRSTALGMLLRRFRGRAGLTQEALADRAGLSLQTITKLERGVHRTPHGDTVQALVGALHLSPQERARFECAACSHHRSVETPLAVRGDMAQRYARAVAALLQTLTEPHGGHGAVVAVIVSPPLDDAPLPTTDAIRLTIR